MNRSDIFLADENIPLFVIKQLRKEGFKIISVAEETKIRKTIWDHFFTSSSKVTGLHISSNEMVVIADKYIIRRKFFDCERK